MIAMVVATAVWPEGNEVATCSASESAGRTRAMTPPSARRSRRPTTTAMREGRGIPLSLAPAEDEHDQDADHEHADGAADDRGDPGDQEPGVGGRRDHEVVPPHVSGAARGRRAPLDNHDGGTKTTVAGPTIEAIYRRGSRFGGPPKI